MNKTYKDIDSYLADQSGWQRDNLVVFRTLVHEVAPDVVEAIKWSVPCFMHKGRVVVAMASFKDFTKFNFFQGASLNDEHHLFNNGLDSQKQRSIDLHSGEPILTNELRELLKEATTT